MDSHEFEQQLPEDLEQAAEWLRAERPEASALDLDRIKQRARSQAMRGEGRSRLARSRRALSTAVSVIALTAGLGGALAIAGVGPPSSPFKAGSSQESAAKHQYCDPKDQHHGECKPCPKGQVRGNDGKCHPQPCPKGQVRGNDGKCHPQPCPKGQVRGSNGKCHPQPCPNGQVRGNDGKCHPQPCPKGQVRGSNGKCTCPKGQHKNTNGSCKPNKPGGHH